MRPTLFALPLMLLLWGCTYGDHHRDPGMGGSSMGGYATGGSSAGGYGGSGTSSTIDADSPVTGYSAGQGAGVFVDYSSGGLWYVSLACDTATSGSDCNWDVIVTPTNGVVTDFGPAALDADDLLGTDTYTSGVRANTFTGYEIDQFYLVTTPGVSVTVDALLDGLTAERYMYWNGGGGLHRGAPSNPLELVPSAP